MDALTRIKKASVGELKKLLSLTDPLLKHGDVTDVYTVRGWIIDEIESKLTPVEFEAWLDSECV